MVLNAADLPHGRVAVEHALTQAIHQHDSVLAGLETASIVLLSG
jgi:hypothetical protein